MIVKLIIVTVLLIENQCGAVDNDKSEDTTVGVKQVPSNVQSYGNVLFGLETSNPQGAQTGLIGGVIQSTREIIQSARNVLFNPNQQSTDRNLLSNVLETVSNGVSSIRDLILPSRGDKPKYTANDNAELIQENLNKLLTANGTKCGKGKACRDAIDKLKKRLEEIQNMKPTTKSPVHYGEGLIDIRMPPNVNRYSKNIDDSSVGVNGDVYDKVNDQ